MKVNWSYLKKPSVIIGAVVLFFILLFMLNRSSGSASSGSTQVVNAGPTDAQVQAQTSLALAQIQAGLQGQAIQVDYAKSQDANATQIALAQVAAAMNTQSLSVQQEIADRTVNAQVAGMNLQYQGLVNQNATALAAAQAQYNYGLQSQAITANTQLELGQQQLQAFQISAVVGALPQLGKYGKSLLLNSPLANPVSGIAQYSQVGSVA